MGAFLWGDLDQDQWSKICLDHGASKEPMNPFWSWIHQFLWRTTIQTDLGSLIMITPKKRSYSLPPFFHRDISNSLYPSDKFNSRLEQTPVPLPNWIKWNGPTQKSYLLEMTSVVWFREKSSETLIILTHVVHFLSQWAFSLLLHVSVLGQQKESCRQFVLQIPS